MNSITYVGQDVHKDGLGRHRQRVARGGEVLHVGVFPNAAQQEWAAVELLL
jgi:hypothetical protein